MRVNQLLSYKAHGLPISLVLMASFLILALFQPATASATTFYLSAGGSDANSGLSSDSPWLTPNHSVSCGDVILAQPSTGYAAQNFGSGHWGIVSCAGNNNVAWLQCETFDACKITTSEEGLYIDQSYW